MFDLNSAPTRSSQVVETQTHRGGCFHRDELLKPLDVFQGFINQNKYDIVYILCIHKTISLTGRFKETMHQVLMMYASTYHKLFMFLSL